MSTYWYVDYENVNSAAHLNSIVSAVKRNDVVIIFYSSATPTIALSFLHKIEAKNARVRTLPCSNGSKNAMDFQIVMEVAANCMSDKQVAHRVVSRDIGYDCPLKAWRARGYDVALCTPGDKDCAMTYFI